MNPRVLTPLAATFALALCASVPTVAAAPRARVSASGGTLAEGAPAAPGSASEPGYAVGLQILRMVDRSRSIRLKGGHTVARTLLTYVRYPAVGAPGAGEHLGAAPDLAAGPRPLVVFAHGFAVTPRTYMALLHSWAAAGYVVAAPQFPRSSAGAPGGPDEADVVNQPGDMSFVITSLIAQSGTPGSALAGTIDPARIAVAGHSDGAETALATAFSRRYRDSRVDAAIVLSGAEMSGIGGYTFPAGGPALLAAQGTEDRFNEPRYTYAYFRAAARPKFLLRLIGAGHLPPYTAEQPQLGLVESVTIAFLEHYLPQPPGAEEPPLSAGTLPGIASLTADP